MSRNARGARGKVDRPQQGNSASDKVQDGQAGRAHFSISRGAVPIDANYNPPPLRPSFTPRSLSSFGQSHNLLIILLRGGMFLCAMESKFSPRMINFELFFRRLFMTNEKPLPLNREERFRLVYDSFKREWGFPRRFDLINFGCYFKKGKKWFKKARLLAAQVATFDYFSDYVGNCETRYSFQTFQLTWIGKKILPGGSVQFENNLIFMAQVTVMQSVYKNKF